MPWAWKTPQQEIRRDKSISDQLSSMSFQTALTTRSYKEGAIL